MKVKYVGVLPKGVVHLGYKDIRFEKNEIFDVDPKDFEKLPKGQFVVDEGGYVAPLTDYEQLVNLKGVEDELADELLRTFGSIEKIKSASLAELESLPGIGKKRAKQIKDQLEGA